MSHQSQNNSRSVFTSISQASFAVAGLAFFGSFACGAINHSLSGWMAVAGMAGLGLFYLALGVLNLGHAPKSLPDREATSSKVVPLASRKEDGKRTRATEAQPDELVEV